MRTGLVALLCALALVLAPSASSPSEKGPVKATVHVEKELQADLLGNDRIYTVQWYRRGPLPPDCPSCPPDWVRGIEVRKGGGKSRILVDWASPRTPIQAPYPELNRLWPTPSPGGDLISKAVQYGGRVMDVYMFRLEGRILREVWHWGGMSATVMKIKGRLVLKAQSDDYFQPPRLYAWTGKEFGDVSRDFPSFYAKLGESVAEAIRDTTSVVNPPAVLVSWCREALADFQLARQPTSGCDACRAAIQRIESGRGVAPAPDEKPEVFEHDKRDTIRQLEALIRRSKGSQ